jgi:hypothetical protein
MLRDTQVCHTSFEKLENHCARVNLIIIHITYLKMAKNVALSRPDYGTMPAFVKSGIVPWLGRPGAAFLRRGLSEFKPKTALFSSLIIKLFALHNLLTIINGYYMIRF